MRTTPPFLKREARHVQASAGVLFYAEVAVFLFSFFDYGFCKEFLMSRPEFLEVFKIETDTDGVEKVCLHEPLGENSAIDAKFADILLNYKITVRFLEFFN